MKILALDHFFGQDLDSLRRAAGCPDAIRAVHYQYFRERFLRLFPEEVLGTNFSAFGSEQYRHRREQWRQQCRGALYELYRIFPFDLVILPSDIFPYIRDVIPAAHELGVPVVVVQKETTISPYTMEVHSRKIGEFFPFLSDYMTVCSERQKQFWLNAGAPAEKIEVTGQPRFDLYGDPDQQRSLSQLGISSLEGRETILFLSYSLGAYIPIEDFNAGRLSWQTLRSETESVLIKHVNEGRYRLLIKPHPQQHRDDISVMAERLRRAARMRDSVQVLPPELDTRQLLLNADIVIGFQTTALLEALLLNRRVIYTCWGEAYKSCQEVVLPYEQHPEALHSVASAEQLDAVLQNTDSECHSESDRLALYEFYLGPSDGRSSERTLAALRRVVSEYVPEDSRQARRMRHRLLDNRRTYLLKECLRLAGQVALDLTIGLAGAAVARMGGHRGTLRGVGRNIFLRLQHGRDLLAALGRWDGTSEELTGRRLRS